MSANKVVGALIIVTLSLGSPSTARDAATDLKKMKGFVVLDAAGVKQTLAGKMGKKVLFLDNKTAFEVDFLLVDPLPLTDVIIFVRPMSKELRDRFKDLPESLLYEYKLLIDNEAYDGRPFQN